MKNLFGIDFSNQDSMIDGNCYFEKEIDQELNRKVNDFSKRYEKLLASTEEPRFFGAIKYIIVLMGVLLIISSIMNVIKDTTGEYFATVGWKPVVLGAILIVCYVLLVYSGRKRKKNNKVQEQLDALKAESEQLYKEKKEALGIPDNAVEFDTFLMGYTKDAKKVSLINVQIAAYEDEDNYYLSDTIIVLRIPKNDFKSYKMVDKKITFIGWNKTTPWKDEQFAEFNLKQNVVGNYISEQYCSIRIEGEDAFELWVPNYEQKTIKEFFRIGEYNDGE